MVAAIFVFAGVLWYLYAPQMIHAFFKLKVWELDLVDIFDHNAAALRYQILSTNPYTIPLEGVITAASRVGDYLRIPFAIILSLLAVVVYLNNTTRMFKTTYSMKTLAEKEQINWPQITPVTQLDLVHTDIDKGPWAMGMTPVQFCKKNNLLEEFRRARAEGSSRRDAERIEVSLKRGEANKVFSLQLGPMWESTQRLPPHVRALFAVFAARMNADSKAAADILAQLNRTSLGKMDFNGVDELLKKHENSKFVKKVIEGNAYVLTVMASMLMAARADGVQASADFLWLKPLDRRLWYVLNSMGRQTPFTEAAGVYAHWLAEKEAGRKLIIPMVEMATNALEIALKELVYHPDEPKEPK